MRNKNLGYLGVLFLGLAIAYFFIKGHFSTYTYGVILFLLIFVPTLIKPDIGLVIIIMSIMFSPEVVAGQTEGRAVSIRIEDIILIVIVFAWLIRTALTKDIGSVFKTKITAPFFLYILICILSSLSAAMFSPLDLKKSFFSILKYIEYFLLFLMVRDNLKSIRQAKLLVALLIVATLLVALHSNAFIQKQIESKASFFRVSTPVETREGGEPGTMGGYLIFMIAIVAGMLIYERSAPIRVFLICLEAAMLRAFLYTLSRGSYVAIIPMAAALVHFAGKIKVTVIYILLAVFILLGVFMPQMIKERIFSTVTIKETFEGSRIEFEESPQIRFDSWKIVLFQKFPASPLIGHGVARSFVDGQLFMLLNEVGLIGLFLFAWMLARLYGMIRSVLDIDLVKNDAFSAGLSLGFLAAFLALLGQSLSMNTFIVIKIMEPFWIVTAIVLALPELLGKEVIQAAEPA